MSREPLLIMTGSGLGLYSENGQMLSEDQIFNCVTMLLFAGSNNYHHDVFLKNQNWKFRGNYEATVRKPITMQMLSDLGSAVESDLKPLIDDKIITELDSVSKNPNGKRIDTIITFVYNGKRLSKTVVFQNDTIKAG